MPFYFLKHFALSLFNNKKEITMNSKSLEVKRRFIKDKIIIGIDLAKKKHKAVILDTAGIPICG